MDFIRFILKPNGLVTVYGSKQNINSSNNLGTHFYAYSKDEVLNKIEEYRVEYNMSSKLMCGTLTSGLKFITLVSFEKMKNEK